jgi:hypothetical protein
VRTCIFCDSTGPLSNEDAWPVWLNKVLALSVPEGATASVLIETTRGFSRELRGLPGIHPAMTGSVCEQCNVGWMSTLEHQVSPILTPLILGEKRQLSEADQELAATWAIKTAITLQRAVPGEVAFPPHSVHTWLRTEQAPPAGYRVFIGAVTEREGKQPLRWDQSKAFVLGAKDAASAASPASVNVFVTMLLAGDLALQIIGDFRQVRRGGVLPIAPTLFDRLWPVRGPLAWPGEIFARALLPVLSQSEVTQTDATIAVEWRPPKLSG